MPQICRAVAESHPDNEVDTKPARRKQDIQVEKSELRRRKLEINTFLRVNLNFRALFGGEAYIRRKVSKGMMGCRQTYLEQSTMME